MTNEVFEEQLRRASERGLVLDSRVERSSVNGVFGLFATDDIEAGTTLVSYPVEKGLQNFSDDRYPSNTLLSIKNVHKAVVEYAKGEKSEYFCHFMQFESLDSFKESSTFFYSEDEVALLGSMNVFLATSVKELKALLQGQINAISALEPSLNKEIIQLVCLNYASRAWDDSNFLPIFDYANHSDRLGSVRSTKDKHYVLTAKVNYKKGDQIFLSYSRKDMYFHAVSYNYFDPNGVHYIQYGARFTQTASNALEKEMAKYTASKFNLQAHQDGNVLMYRCMDQHACLLENGPSLRLIEYIQSNYFPTKVEWDNKKCSDGALAKRLLGIIEILNNENKVDQFQLDEIPARLHRFYYLLKKEKKMLQANRDWVVDNFYL